MAAFDLKRELRRRGAVLEGHFRLSSGRHSDRFIQKFRVLEDPKVLEPIASQLAGKFRDKQPTVVLSAAVGGIVLGYEVARKLGVKAIFAEKEAGRAVLRRGFVLQPADRVLVVEDVLTTGRSVQEIVDIARAAGAEVVGIGAIVRRGEIAFDVPAAWLLDMPFDAYDEVECPQCRAGLPITDPGSRRAGTP
ncbi:MAG TPA: orotate phosphoribosyltransferase [Candidatus Rubrimentiphilum sp.]|nr:orotate phosphoribosyltransferase [Candidatus Rubrimentiphilum sp.]